MAFQIRDFKRTSRNTPDGRMLYPHQIRDERYHASISYAIGYYEQMLGRRRAEFEADALLEFFGDPRLARGMVACLAETYAWHTPSLNEAIGEPAAQALRRARLGRPIDLRAHLFALANERYGGYIPPEIRREVVRGICPHVTAAQIERALALDSEQEQVLVRRGAIPEARRIIERYNYHSLETSLNQASQIELQLEGHVWSMVCSAHNLTRRYRIGYVTGDNPSTLFATRLDLILQGQRDALGGWARAGRRLTRVVLRLLAAHPGAVKHGRITLQIGGQRAHVRLDAEALRLLGAGADHGDDGTIWEETQLEQMQRAWERAWLAGRTGGWRLRRDPQPVAGAGTLVVPDFVLRRGPDIVGLCMASGQAAAQALQHRLTQLGERSHLLVMAPERITRTLKRSGTLVVPYHTQPADALPALIDALERIAPAHASTPLSSRMLVEHQLASNGFIDEQTITRLMGCPTPQALTLIRSWGNQDVHILPGLGICDTATLAEIRGMLDQAA